MVCGCLQTRSLAMAITPTELLGAAAFPLMLLAGVVALASILFSRAGRMEPDDWIAAILVRTRTASPISEKNAASCRAAPRRAAEVRHTNCRVLQAGMTVVGGASFHMLPAQQGSVGTSALLTMIPFGALLVLCCHLFDSAAQGVLGLGAFAPRLVLAPLIVYIVYSAWTRLLGAVPNIWNAVLYVLCRSALLVPYPSLLLIVPPPDPSIVCRVGYAGTVLCGWLVAGWFIDATS